MKKIIIFMVLLFSFSTSFANESIEILSKWTKNVNNMKCDYIEMSYDDFYNNYKDANSENIIDQNKDVDTKKIKLSKLSWFDFFSKDNWDESFNEYIKTAKEQYNWKSYSINMVFPLRNNWFFSIYKDWKYIYNGREWRYYNDGTYWFNHYAYSKNGPWWNGTFFIFSKCKEVITGSYQTTLNIALKNTFEKIDKNFENDEEQRILFYENFNSKINKILNWKLSQKNKFVIEYIKEASSYYQNKKYGYNMLPDDKDENIWYSDFIN